jgi:hypothetical protein
VYRFPYDIKNRDVLQSGWTSVMPEEVIGDNEFESCLPLQLLSGFGNISAIFQIFSLTTEAINLFASSQKYP